VVLNVDMHLGASLRVFVSLLRAMGSLSAGWSREWGRRWPLRAQAWKESAARLRERTGATGKSRSMLPFL